MKIGRNESCPCGSGRKYKKCCISSVNITDKLSAPTKINMESNFINLQDKTLKLAGTISQYTLEDVATAIYCFASWRDNRSALESCLALNNCILCCDSFGEKRIQSYNDLKVFYKNISTLLQPSDWDDYIHGDFGEVSIKYNNTNYPVILGTGHEQVYAALHFLLSLVNNLERQDELITLLEYTKFYIMSLHSNNKQHYAYEKRFDLPSEEYWQSTVELFNNPHFLELVTEAEPLFATNDAIERTHFVKRNSKIIPLFNTSILLDYYHRLLGEAGQDKDIENVQEVIHTSLHSIFECWGDGSNLKVLFPVAMRDDVKRISCKPFDFVAFAKDKCIVAFNGECLQNR